MQRLAQDGIITLDLRQGDLELLFLQPREDARTIHAFANSVKERQKVKKEKVRHLSAYLKNTSKCRQIQLLGYFGETLEDTCGRCDVCLSQMAVDTPEELHIRILELLKRSPKTSRELIEEGLKPEKSVLESLQFLLEAGKLRMGDCNEYILTEK